MEATTVPKGVFERSDEHRRHISEALKGKPRSAEHRQNLSLANLGKKVSPETRRKLAEAHLGSEHPWTEAQKKRLSEQRKGISYTLLSRYGISIEEQDAQRLLGNRWCCEHKGYAPASEFKGRQTFCTPCTSAFNRRVLLRADYRLDAEWYPRQLEQQGGGCAICGSTKSGRRDHKFLPIDHNHKTGAVRGILCNRCNAFVGMLEAPGLHRKALEYLAKYA